MSYLDIPAGPEESTPAWFTMIFRETMLLVDSAVVQVQTEIIGQDTGFTGVVARVHLHYADHQAMAPSSVVVKLPTASRETPSAYRSAQEKDEAARRRYVERCAREVAFYQEVALLSALSVPRLYYSAADAPADRVVLVLEDLYTAHVGDALRGCSPNDALVLIDQLGQFHARWWNHPHLETFSWLPLWGGDSQEAQQRYIQCIEPFLYRFGQRMPERIRQMVEALATNYGAVRRRLQYAPLTMIHGDLYLDNMLSAAPSTPALTIIDWPGVAQGRAAIDVASVLSGMLEAATRRTTGHALLQRYHAHLLAGGVTGYDFAQLLEDCRVVLLWRLGAQVVWRGSLDLEKLSGREQALVERFTEDNFTALLDYDAGSFLQM
ncbi:MAG TPA: phosphotransferase [Ktedonobacteraceae bacterium]